MLDRRKSRGLVEDRFTIMTLVKDNKTVHSQKSNRLNNREENCKVAIEKVKRKN